MLVLKDAANSYRKEGRIFGIDILSIMFQPNKLIDCLLVDAIIFYGTSFWCVPLQKAVKNGYIKWDKEGWVLQILWQGVYMWAIIEYTLYKEWSWIQTVCNHFSIPLDRNLDPGLLINVLGIHRLARPCYSDETALVCFF